MKGKVNMRDKKDLKEYLKLLGLQTENQLNQLIQKRLSDKNLIHLANLSIQKHTEDLKSLHDYQELLALQLNIPTKDDVANVAKIAIQIEEKLDLLENQIFYLMEEIQSLHHKNGNKIEKQPSKLYELKDWNKRRKKSG
jgi:hypothetical protein